MSSILRGIGCALVVFYLIQAAWAVAVLVFLAWAFRNPEDAMDLARRFLDWALALVVAVLNAFSSQAG